MPDPTAWLIGGAFVLFFCGQPGGAVVALAGAWAFSCCTNQFQVGARRRR